MVTDLSRNYDDESPRKNEIRDLMNSIQSLEWAKDGELKIVLPVTSPETQEEAEDVQAKIAALVIRLSMLSGVVFEGRSLDFRFSTEKNGCVSLIVEGEDATKIAFIIRDEGEYKIPGLEKLGYTTTDNVRAIRVEIEGETEEITKQPISTNLPFVTTPLISQILEKIADNRAELMARLRWAPDNTLQIKIIPPDFFEESTEKEYCEKTSLSLIKLFDELLGTQVRNAKMGYVDDVYCLTISGADAIFIADDIKSNGLLSFPGAENIPDSTVNGLLSIILGSNANLDLALNSTPRVLHNFRWENNCLHLSMETYLKGNWDTVIDTLDYLAERLGVELNWSSKNTGNNYQLIIFGESAAEIAREIRDKSQFSFIGSENIPNQFMEDPAQLLASHLMLEPDYIEWKSRSGELHILLDASPFKNITPESHPKVKPLLLLLMHVTGLEDDEVLEYEAVIKSDEGLYLVIKGEQAPKIARTLVEELDFKFTGYRNIPEIDRGDDTPSRF